MDFILLEYQVRYHSLMVVFKYNVNGIKYCQII